MGVAIDVEELIDLDARHGDDEYRYDLSSLTS